MQEAVVLSDLEELLWQALLADVRAYPGADEGVIDMARPHVATIGQVLQGPRTQPITGVWLLIRPWSIAVVVGAGRAGCARCLALWARELHGEGERQLLSSGDWAPVSATLHAFRCMIGTLTSVLRLRGPQIGPHVIELDCRTGSTRRYEIVPHDACAQCSPPEPSSQRGRPTSDEGRTGFRARDATQLGLETSALVNPLCGALSDRLHLDLDSPTMAGVFGQTQVDNGHQVVGVGWAGQATSYASSRTAALLEGMERRAGTSWPEMHSIRASLRELGVAALDPRKIGVYSDQVYAESPHLTKFDDDLVLDWIPGWSLTDGSTVLVPEQCVHYANRRCLGAFIEETSNGCAVGSSITEAAFFALLEVIERDQFMLGWYRSVSLPQISLASVSSRARHLVARIERQGYHVTLLDNRIDMAVPTVTALAVAETDQVGAHSIASASALTVGMAAEGALMEVATYVPQLSQRIQPRVAQLTAMAADFERVRILQDHAELGSLREMSGFFAHYFEGSFAGMADQRDSGAISGVNEVDVVHAHRYGRVSDARAGLRAVVDELASRGLEVILVDQTTALQRQFGLHVVRAIVPGSLPMDFGWSKQRAFSLPRLNSAFVGARVTPGQIKFAPHPFP